MEAFYCLVVCYLLSPGYAHYHHSPLDTLWKEKPQITLASGVTLKIRPYIIEKSGDWITVSWYGLSNPSHSDWVGIYSPPSYDVYRINPTQHAPIKYQYANVSSNHMKRGKGKLRFRMINMRQKIVAGFFTGGFDDAILLSVSNTSYFKNPHEPLQGHLALTGDPTEMVLMWVSKNAYIPVVYWGTSSRYYFHTKQATSFTYTSDDMCGSPAMDFGWRKPGMLNRVKMTNLSPGTRYYYIFGDTYGWSEEFSFKAAPQPGPNVNVTVISFGDMGCGEVDDSLMMETEIPSINTTNHILDQIDDVDFVMHIGDISYAQGYSSVWDVFFDQIAPIATQVPYMVSIGNHERNWNDSLPGYYNNSDSGGECGVPYSKRFPMPRPTLDHPWYGFDYGSIHFVLMSTEHDFRQGSQQYSFLYQHLQTVDRSVTPWLIFSGHRPMYVATTDNDWPDGHIPVAESLRENLEELLMEYQVDIALWAHHHSYQRSCSVYQEACLEDGIVHFVIGMGGRGHSDDLIPAEDDFPEYIEVLDYEHYGYLRISANATRLVTEYVWNDDNEVHDTFVIEKSA